ncbi:Uncharacterised protein [Mycobacteroides abscessus subsp. abscessus]|nr:Uncharacterised protein [Mycobacteroides abscessus subsp. abscessus]
MRLLNQCGMLSNIICPPGKRLAQASISPRDSSGCRYISSPSAVSACVSKARARNA